MRWSHPGTTYSHRAREGRPGGAPNPLPLTPGSRPSAIYVVLLRCVSGCRSAVVVGPLGDGPRGILGIQRPLEDTMIVAGGHPSRARAMWPHHATSPQSVSRATTSAFTHPRVTPAHARPVRLRVSQLAPAPKNVPWSLGRANLHRRKWTWHALTPRIQTSDQEQQ